MAGPPPSRPSCLAVDIGGTKLAAAVVGPDGTLLAGARCPTPRGLGPDDAETLFSALADLVGSVLGSAPAGAPPALCGVACGGPMTAGGDEVSPLNIPGWRGFPLRRRMAELTGLPVTVDNDAKALALGEGWKGAAAGCEDFIAMVVSTGVGGGIVLEGRLLDGASGNAGHIGHVNVVPNGRPCACGARGCLEAEVSGTGIAAATGRPAPEAGADVVARTGRLVGRAVGSVANLLDLRLAVVGGSVALGFGAPFFAAAQREIDRRSRLDFSLGTRIVPAALGGEGGLVGAAAMAYRASGSGAYRASGSGAHRAPRGGGGEK
ncbi:MAG TPA: ROK family protein [Acidimicrobiales bacterium]|nr:ROK family protein [Acidimicrobiales bacterium]